MPQRTALFDAHVASGARMVDFGGWEMPINYGSQIEEHHQVRQAAGDDLPTTPRNPESAAFGTQVQAQVQDALLQLPNDLRIATVLYDIEGLSYREIATALEIPEGTVKSRIHRARSALREGLRDLMSNENKGE